VFPNVEIRHLHAVIALAEELNFTRAADRLHITQPALSKQITDLEAEHRFHLFTRHKRRIVELSDAGVSTMLAIRLPLYPRLGIRLKTQFAMESVHSVLVGEVNLAIVTAPPQDTQITAVPFAPAPLYAVTKSVWFSGTWPRMSGFYFRNVLIQ
jgi:DNA-binding transcriptional LysR family regulator